MAVTKYTEIQETPKACEYKLYCHGECEACDGDALDAAKSVLEQGRRS